MSATIHLQTLILLLQLTLSDIGVLCLAMSLAIQLQHWRLNISTKKLQFQVPTTNIYGKFLEKLAKSISEFVSERDNKGYLGIQ